MVDLSLLSSRPRGENFFWRRVRASCQGGVTVEGEVVLINVHSRVWVCISHLIFNGGNSSVHGQREDEARHGASLGQTPSSPHSPHLTTPHSHSLTPHSHSLSLTLTHSHSLSLSLTLTHSLTLTSHSLSLTLTHSHSLSLTLTHSHSHSLTLTHSLTHSFTHSLSLTHLAHSLTHSCIDDSEMDPCHTELHRRIVGLRPRAQCIRRRGGGRSETSEGAGSKTAEGNKHAEEQATGPVEPHRDPRRRRQTREHRARGTGRAGRRARNRPQGQRTYPLTPSQEPGSSSRRPQSTRGRRNKHEKSLGRCFSSRSPANPGCRRPPVLTPMPYLRQTPRRCHASCRLLLKVEMRGCRNMLRSRPPLWRNRSH